MADPESVLVDLRAESPGRIADLQRQVRGLADEQALTTHDDEHDPEGVTIGYQRAQMQGLLARLTPPLPTPLVEVADERFGDVRVLVKRDDLAHPELTRPGARPHPRLPDLRSAGGWPLNTARPRTAGARDAAPRCLRGRCRRARFDDWAERALELLGARGTRPAATS